MFSYVSEQIMYKDNKVEEMMKIERAKGKNKQLAGFFLLETSKILFSAKPKGMFGIIMKFKP